MEAATRLRDARAALNPAGGTGGRTRVRRARHDRDNVPRGGSSKPTAASSSRNSPRRPCSKPRSDIGSLSDQRAVFPRRQQIREQAICARTRATADDGARSKCSGPCRRACSSRPSAAAARVVRRDDGRVPRPDDQNFEAAAPIYPSIGVRDPVGTDERRVARRKDRPVNPPLTLPRVARRFSRIRRVPQDELLRVVGTIRLPPSVRTRSAAHSMFWIVAPAYARPGDDGVDVLKSADAGRRRERAGPPRRAAIAAGLVADAHPRSRLSVPARCTSRRRGR